MRARITVGVSRRLLAVCVAPALLAFSPLAATAIPPWTQLAIEPPGPAVAQWEPVIWDANANRALYPQDVTLWSLAPSSGTTWSGTPIGGPLPNVHTGVGAAFDAARNRVLFFGGVRGNGLVNEVWELTLGDSPAWRKLVPTGIPPANRYFASVVLDAPGDRLIVFGGAAGTHEYSDLWSLSIASGDGVWQQLIADGQPGSPSGRERQSAIFDPVRRRMVIFGGVSTGVLSNDVWALPLAPPAPIWQQITTAGAPSPRDQATAVYDSANDRMVIQGGVDLSGPFSDAAALPFTGSPTWAGLPSDPNGAQYAHAAVYDPSARRMLMPFDLDTRALDLGPSPQWSFFERRMAARTQVNGAIAQDSRTFVITGGNNTPETRTLDLTDAAARWQLLAVTGGPQARVQMAMVWDPVRTRFLAFGGAGTGADYHNDVWSLTLGPPAQWTQVTTTGTPPAPYFGWRAVYDPSGDRVILLTLAAIEYCCQAPSYTNSIFELPLGGPSALQWSNHSMPAGWKMRKGASLSYDPGRDAAWIYGGEDSTTFSTLGDVWKVDLTGTPSASLVATTGTAPSSRQLHAAVFDPGHDQLIVYGGWHDPGVPGPPRVFLDDTWALETGAGNQWIPLSPDAGRPPARIYMASDLDVAGGRVVMFGGNANDSYKDTWALPLSQTLGVDPGVTRNAGLRVAPSHGNPVAGDVAVDIILPADGNGSLDLLDVAGRLVRSTRLDGIPAGTHSVTLARGTEVPAGIYFARLRQGTVERRIRLAILH